MKRDIQSKRVKGEHPLTDQQREKIRKIQNAAPDPSDVGQAQSSKQRVAAIRTKLTEVMALLKTAREDAGVSLRELEQRTGMSRGSLSRLESGQGNPTIATLQRIAEAIGREVMITVK